MTTAGGARTGEARTGGAPAVSVVVPVHDDEDGLHRCLRALAAQTLPRAAYEVVVVDDGSAVDLRGVVGRHAGVRLVRQSNRGSYAARNRGVAEARGHVLAFTDADCRPEPDWLASGVALLERRRDAGLVAGAVRVVPRDAARPTAAELYEMLHAFPQQQYVERSRFGVTANVFTRRDVVERVGAFDATLRSGGDVEFGQRVAAAGYAVVYAPDAVVTHPARATWGQLRRKLARVTRGAQTASRDRPGLRRESLVRAVRLLRPPVLTLARVATDTRLPTAGARARYGLALCYARQVRAWTLLRYWLGRRESGDREARGREARGREACGREAHGRPTPARRRLTRGRRRGR